MRALREPCFLRLPGGRCWPQDDAAALEGCFPPGRDDEGCRPPLYSRYIRRHEAPAALADLALTGGDDDDVRKAADDLARAHREAPAKLERTAGERHLTLTPPDHDTTTALLEQARSALAFRQSTELDKLRKKLK